MSKSSFYIGVDVGASENSCDNLIQASGNL